MTGEKRKLYLLLIFSCFAGYGWILLNSVSAYSAAEICIIKHAAGFPCPSCGTTRAVLSILEGNPGDALRWNPFGFIAVLFLSLCPLWILYDILKKKSTFFTLYKQGELFLRHKWVAVAAVCLVLGNWIWNICKGV